MSSIIVNMQRIFSLKCTNIILYFLCLCLFIGCKTTHRYVNEDNLCNRSYKISEKQKSIDISEYQIIYQGNPILTKENQFFKKSYVNYGNNNEDLVLYTYHKNSKVSRILSYDIHTGKIKREIYTLSKKRAIGTQREYDMKGNVVDSIKYTSTNNYRICHIEAVEIVKEKIKRNEKYNTEDHLVNKLEIYEFPKKYPYKWSVIIYPKKGNKKWFHPLEYIVDAMTGKIIEVRKKTRR